MANISKSLFLCLATHLSSSSRSFLTEKRLYFLAFGRVDVRYSVNIIIFGSSSQTDVMLHHIAQGLLDKKNLFWLLLILKASVFKLVTINNMRRDLWTTGSLIPFSNGSKIPSDTIFTLSIIAKKVYGINSQPFAVLKLFPWTYHICKKSFKKSCLSLAKSKKHRYENFAFFFEIKIGPQKLTWQPVMESRDLVLVSRPIFCESQSQRLQQGLCYSLLSWDFQYCKEMA